MTACSELVYLRGGLTVPLAALEILWNLENRGATFRIDGDDIVIRPRGLAGNSTSKPFSVTASLTVCNDTPEPAANGRRPRRGQRRDSQRASP